MIYLMSVVGRRTGTERGEDSTGREGGGADWRTATSSMHYIVTIININTTVFELFTFGPHHAPDGRRHVQRY